MLSPLSSENMRRLDRYCPDHAPYKKASQLGALSLATFRPYAASIMISLIGRRAITVRESYYLYFISVILEKLGAAAESLALKKQVSACPVMDLEPVSSGHTDPSVMIPGLGNVKKVNWRFLPNPENLTPGELLNLLKQHFTEHSSHITLQLDIARVEFALLLKPQEIFVGLEEFAGYYAFVFRNDVVLFECPAHGNAAYIVRGDWQVLSRQYKAQLEMKGVRVIHRTRSWKRRIRAAIAARLLS